MSPALLTRSSEPVAQLIARLSRRGSEQDGQLEQRGTDQICPFLWLQFNS